MMVERIRGRRQVLNLKVLQEFLAKEWGIYTDLVEWKRGTGEYRRDGYALVKKGISNFEAMAQTNHFFIPSDCMYMTKDKELQIDFDYLKKGVIMFRYDLAGYAMYNLFRDKIKDVTVRDNYLPHVTFQGVG